MVLSGGRLAKETNNDGGVKDFTVTPVTDEDDKIHNAQDVNVIGDGGLATAANQTSGTQKTQVTSFPAVSALSDSISSVDPFLVGVYDSGDISDNAITVEESDSIEIENYGNADITITINAISFVAKAYSTYAFSYQTSFTTVGLSASADNFQLFALKRGEPDDS